MPGSANELYLCLDQGGHASRAIVVDGAGVIHAQAFAAIGTVRHADIVEHDPLELVESLRRCADAALTQLGPQAGQVRAAGLATQRSSIVCWDRSSGVPLSAVLSWQDTRAAGWLESYVENWDRVHAITGLALSPHYGVSKLVWCLENLPDVRAAQADGQLVFGPLAAYLAQALTLNPQALADPANASRTLLWDRRTRDWSPELLDLFGIAARDLPQCVPSQHAWGNLAVAGHSLPLTVVTGDQSAAYFAFGLPSADDTFINMGTGAFVQRRAPDSDLSSGRLLASVVYQDAQSANGVIEGTVNGAGSAIDAIAKQRRLEKNAVHAQSADWLRDTRSPPLFINSVSGLGSPWWRVDLDSRFEPIPHDDAEALVAVMESVVFLLAVNLRCIESLLGPAARIVVTGGLGSVDPLVQRLADVTQRPVVRALAREATALGLAFLLAGLPDQWPGVQVEASFAPEENAELRGRFARWSAEMPPVPE